MSVESLQGSFSAIDEKVARAIEKRASDSELAGVIQTAWHGQFHRPLSLAATKGLIEHYRAVHTEGGAPKRRTRKAGRRGQRGGMAPLAWTMGQGSTAPIYGAFPVEMGMSAQAVRTLDLGRFFESPISRACDSTGGAPAQKGGGVLDAILMGHPPASVPPNFVESVTRAAQGVATPGPYDPMRASIPTAVTSMKPFDTTQMSPVTSLAPVWSGSF